MTTSRLLVTDDDLAEGLAFLVAADPRLAKVAEASGSFGRRYRAPGFAGLARIVCGQQLSVASADAIWARFATLLGTPTAENYLAATPEALRAVGLSAGKVRTLNALAAAEAGGLDIEALAESDPDRAIEALVAIHGIGRWTADIFLLFCARQADVFPAGDLALQIAAEDAFGLAKRPSEKELRAIAEAWAPWRGVAAKLLWAYYAKHRARTAIPV